MIAWCNNNWVDSQTGALSVLDRGFTLGDGLFETILWDGQSFRRFSAHSARLHASAAALELPAPPEAAALAQIARDTLRRNQLDRVRAAVRMTWSAGIAQRGLLRGDAISPTLVISAAPSVKSITPAIVASSKILRNETAPSSRHKTLSYIDNIIAQAQAAKIGAGEALQFNTQDNLAGGACSNIFVVIDEQVFTPRLDDGALPGTVRAALLAGNVTERPISKADVARAEAAAITNALQEVRIVARVDEQPLRIDHPLIRALQISIDAT